MLEFTRSVRASRRALGLSQASLAGIAEVSLATLQNLEAGRANPSMSVLERILEPLGLGVEIRSESADWAALAALGAPFAAEGVWRGRRDGASLAAHVRGGALDIVVADPGTPDRERKLECLEALLLALRLHFPTVHQRYFGRSPLVASMLGGTPSGRVIKLSRLARATLAEYL
jgi:transcriptional regulator with XRE-family HTH domain